MKLDKIKFEFVTHIPKDVEDEILYVSIPFSIAIHKCACGCGEKVVTPITPTDWILIFNGDSVSLYPSIGNWSLPCQSHYFITKNKINWCGRWSKSKIKKGRLLDKKIKKEYYDR